MSTPNIDVVIYPPGPSKVERQLQYLELARANSMAAPVCPLPLQIWISNKQASNIHLEQVDVVFLDAALNKTITVSLDVAAGGNNAWYASNGQYLFLPSPPPSPFTITLHFTGFDPWSAAVHFVPFPHSHNFPGKYSDLGPDEFWVGKGAAHAGGGDQIFHYDLGIMGWDGKSQWSDLLPGKDNKSNDHFRIWNRPVYAIADGVVTFYENSVSDNPAPGATSPDGALKGYGNAFNIQHGDYLGTYMHMRPGSLSPALTQGFPEGVEFPNGPSVKAGDFLGLAGNAGTSTAPHLHVGLVLRDAQKRAFSVPLAFTELTVVQDSMLDHMDVPGSPWVKAFKQGLPWVADVTIRDAVEPFHRRRAPAAHRPLYEAAIDPLALVLTGDAYIHWTLPDPPPIDVLTAQVRAQVRAMGPEERRHALARVRSLREYAEVMEREMNEQR